MVFVLVVVDVKHVKLRHVKLRHVKLRHVKLRLLHDKIRIALLYFMVLVI
jgi:hypothetical protein